MGRLRGADPLTKYKVLVALLIQTAIAVNIVNCDWWVILVVAYSVGGTINHSMTLAMHEISHNLAFDNSLFFNTVVGFLSNLPLGIPAFISFKRYHMEHHKYQGEQGVDTDIPTAVEGFVVGHNPLLKAIWMVLQPAFYALRPPFVAGKTPSAMEGVNWLVQVGYDVALCAWCGWSPIPAVYLIASTLLGMGIHPMAGHFVAEHYTFVRGQETYSYYGPLNWFSFNVGYHNEHHDFANVSGCNLPKLPREFPDLYDDLPVHHSWVKVIWQYITSPVLSPYSRIRRHTLSNDDVRTINRS